MRKTGWKWIAGYTALFAVFFAGCYGAMLLSGGSNIWEIDGLMQHYPYMMYVGQWLRGALSSLLSGQGAATFDFSLGFGEDVISALNYYGLGDPLMLLSALFTGAATESCYLLLIALKGWLAGLACMALARRVGMGRWQALGAGVLYAFSLGFFTEAATHHAMFANPYLHLPLILLGMECAFDRRRGWLLSLAILLSALCGFYFLYCNTLLLLLYALLRHFTRGAEHPWRALPLTALRAIGWYLLGIGLSACVLLPVLHGFFNGQRAAGGEAALRLHDSLSAYLRYPMAALTGRAAGATPFVPAVGLFAVLLMLLRPRTYRRWLPMLAAMALMLAVPAVGLALNGFSYESTRWNYAAYLLAAMAVGQMLPELTQLARREKIALSAAGGALLVYALLALAANLGGRRLYAILMAAFVLLALAAIFTAGALRRAGSMRLAAGCLAAAVLVNVALAHSLAWAGRRDELLPRGESYAATSDSVYAALPDGNDFLRTDTTIESTGEQMNASSLEGVMSTSIYNSVLNGPLCAFMADVENAGRLNVNVLDGLDCRAALEALWSVGRYVCAPDAGGRIPYGFAPAGETENGFLVYENPNALPLGRAMLSAISSEEYAALSPLEKQWALLQCAVTEELPEGIAHGEPVQSVREIPVRSMEWENAVWEDGLLTAGEGAELRLTFDAPADCELYLQLNGFGLTDGRADLSHRMSFESGGCSGEIVLLPDSDARSAERPYSLVNLGYDAAGRAGATLRFSAPGEYRLESLSLLVQPMANYAQLVAGAQGMEDVSVQAGRVTGRIDLRQSAVMVFAIPWSEGWTAAVNGEPVETMPSAGAFLALTLPEGEHQIELTYRTPWLRAGLILSAASLLILVGAIVWERRRRAVKGANR